MTQKGQRFYYTLAYPYNPLFKVSMSDIANFVYEKRPTLRYRNDVELVIDNKNDNKIDPVQALIMALELYERFEGMQH